MSLCEETKKFHSVQIQKILKFHINQYKNLENKKENKKK